MHCRVVHEQIRVSPLEQRLIVAKKGSEAVWLRDKFSSNNKIKLTNMYIPKEWDDAVEDERDKLR